MCRPSVAGFRALGVFVGQASACGGLQSACFNRARRLKSQELCDVFLESLWRKPVRPSLNAPRIGRVDALARPLPHGRGTVSCTRILSKARRRLGKPSVAGFSLRRTSVRPALDGAENFRPASRPPHVDASVRPTLLEVRRHHA